MKSLLNYFFNVNVKFLGLGFITTDLLREILKELDEKMTKEDLDQMIEEIDADGSGTVDWEGIVILVM